MLYNVTKCSDLKLRIPKSKHNNLAEVNPDLFASAASRLEELDVSGELGNKIWSRPESEKCSEQWTLMTRTGNTLYFED